MASPLVVAENREQPPSNTAKFGQWQLLALLRFGLSLVVVASHLWWFGGPVPVESLSVFGGRASVLAFLFISGYSIAASIYDKPDRFYRRRFLRIYPLYFAAIALVTGLVLFWGPIIHAPHWEFKAPGTATLVCNALLVQQFACIAHSYNLPLWSLSVECFYYLLAPLLVRLRARHIIIIIAISAGVFIYSELSRTTALMGFDALRLACFWLSGFVIQRHRKNAWAIALIVMVIPLAFFLDEGDLRILPTLLTASILLWTPEWKLPSAAKKIADFLGDISYPLYLLHVPGMILGVVLLKTTHPNFLFLFMIAFVIVTYFAVDVYFKNGILRRIPFFGK